MTTSTVQYPSLTIHTDGGSRGNPGPAATGVVILDPAGNSLYQFGRFLGTATNNEAEYLAVVDALTWVAQTLPPPLPQLKFKLDSKLVVEQLSRRWKIKESRLFDLASEVWALLETHHLVAVFAHIPREQNSAADAEVNRVLDQQNTA